MLHGHRHHDRQLRAARIMIATALGRFAIWTILLALNLAGIPAIVTLFVSVRFVSDLSVIALMLTDWGQFAASLAQLAAARGHQDAEHARHALTTDLPAIERDLARLAALQPGPEAQQLAAQIRVSLTHP